MTSLGRVRSHYGIATPYGIIALLALSGCAPMEGGANSVGASVSSTVVTRSGHALTIDGQPATFEAINGGYGDGCTARSGGWSTPIGNFAGALPSAALSVVAHNGTSCVLTLTSLLINGHTYAPDTSLALAAAYAPTALTFVTNSEPFYANFKMTPDDFSGPFSLDMFASDDVSEVPGTVTASYARVSATGTTTLNPAPDYSVDTSNVGMTTDSHVVLQSLTGNVVMTAGSVTGSHYVLDASALDTSSTAAVEAAYVGGTENVIAGSPFNVAATDLGLVIGVTILPATRYIIVKNAANGVTTYEVIAVTFNPAP